MEPTPLQADKRPEFDLLTEEDKELIEQIAVLSLVKQPSEISTLPEHWDAEYDKMDASNVAASALMYRKEVDKAKRSESTSNLPISEAEPKDEAGWAALLHKLAPPDLVELLRLKDHGVPEKKLTSDAFAAKEQVSKQTAPPAPAKQEVARGGESRSRPLNNAELFHHLLIHTRHMTSGRREVDWVDPHMSNKYKPRPLREITPVGVGYDCAVILASRPVAKPPSSAVPSKKASGDIDTAPKRFQLYVVTFTDTTTTPANVRTADDYASVTKGTIDHTILKRRRVMFFDATNLPAFERPQRANVHGDYVSLGWESPTDCTLQFFKLPACSPTQWTHKVCFPAGSLYAYDLYYPYLVLAVRPSVVRKPGIFWNWKGSDKWDKPSFANAPDGDYAIVIVLNIETHEWVNAIRVMCAISALSISPRQTSHIERKLPHDRLRFVAHLVYRGPQPEPKNIGNHHVLDEPLLPVPTPGPMVTIDLCKSLEHELKQAEELGQEYDSHPQEPAEHVYKYMDGTYVQWSANNITHRSQALPPYYANNEVYYARDTVNSNLDCLVHGTVCVTLRSNYKVHFSRVRCPDPSNAFQLTAPVFDASKDLPLKRTTNGLPLEAYTPPTGTRPERAKIPLFSKSGYKAIWASTTRLAVLLPSGELALFRSNTEEEVKDQDTLLRQIEYEKQQKEYAARITERKMAEGKAVVSGKQSAVVQHALLAPVDMMDAGNKSIVLPK